MGFDAGPRGSTQEDGLIKWEEEGNFVGVWEWEEKHFRKGNSIVKGLEVTNDMTLRGMRRLILPRSPEIRAGAEAERRAGEDSKSLSGRDVGSFVKTMGKH